MKPSCLTSYRYRPYPVGDVLGNASKVAAQPLKAKNRVLVLKARSKLERDAWCWALNTEIERFSRRTSRDAVAQEV
jgi:Pleckstrin homology domain